MDVIKFPATNAALWYSQPTGTPVYVHASYYRLPFIVLEERSVRLAQRFSQNYKESEYVCHLIASVTTDPDAEGVKISIDHIDPDPKYSQSNTEDLVLRCLVRKDSSFPLTSERIHSLIRTVQEGCFGKNRHGLTDVMAGMMTCHSQQGQSHIVYADIDVVLPSVVFKATLIKPVPIVMTALSKNLAGPMSLSEVQGESKSGYLTMDQTHKLLLILASDPKAVNLPLVGIWVSGVAMVHDPFVWRSCLHYQFSLVLKNRVCQNPEPFLIVLYSSLRSKPEFYQCVTANGNSDLNFELYSCHEVIHLSKKPGDRPSSPMELELTVVNSGRKLTLFEAALQTISKKDLSDSSNPTTTSVGSFPRKHPAPPSSRTAVVQPSVSEVTLLYDDCEPRPHPSAQAPYPSPQPLPQAQPTKSKSKEKRKQSLKSPRASMSSQIQLSQNVIMPPETHCSITDALINSHLNYGSSATNSKTSDQLSVQISPQNTHQSQTSSPSVWGGSSAVTAFHVNKPSTRTTNNAMLSDFQYHGHPGPASFDTSGKCHPVSKGNWLSVHNHHDIGFISHVPHNNHESAAVQNGIMAPTGLQGMVQHTYGAYNHLHTSTNTHMGQEVHNVASQVQVSSPNGARQHLDHSASPALAGHCSEDSMSRPCVASHVSGLSSFQYMSPQTPCRNPPCQTLVSSGSQSRDMSDNVQKQTCCNCSMVSSEHNPSEHKSNFNNSGASSADKSAVQPNDSYLYSIVQQQEAQIQMLREQISLLLAKQETSTSETPVCPTAHQPCDLDRLNRSVGCNTSPEPEPNLGAKVVLDKSVQYSDWSGEKSELQHNPTRLCQSQLLGFNMVGNPNRHSNGDYSNSSNSGNTSCNNTHDHSEDASCLSFGEFEMNLNKVHDNSQESLESTMVLDLPEYGPVSPDRSVLNSQSPEGTEIGDVSPVPSESVSTCEQAHADEYEQTTEDSRDTGLGDSNAQASLLLNDHRLFYKNVLENVYKHFLTQTNSHSNDTVVSAPDFAVHHTEVDNQVLRRSYDDCLAASLRSSSAKDNHPGRKVKPANVAQITKEALAKLGINTEKENPHGVSRQKDKDSVYLDLAQLPRAEYLTMSQDTDSECSVEMDVLAMKYLKDDQLAELAKGKGHRSRHNHLMTTPSKAGSVSNMSYTSRKYLERYGLLDNDNQSAITSATGHSLRLPTLFNVHDFLQKLSENSSAVGNESIVKTQNIKTTSVASDLNHSHNRPQSSYVDHEASRSDPSQMTLNEMGQFLGLSKAFDSSTHSEGLPKYSTPHSGHFTSR